MSEIFLLKFDEVETYFYERSWKIYVHDAYQTRYYPAR